MHQILKAAGAPKDLIHGLNFFKCDACDEKTPTVRRHPVSAPKQYVFNFEVIVDCLEVKDWVGDRYTFLSIVSNGTTFHAVGMVRPGGGSPKSSKCLAKFHVVWVGWAGYPTALCCDRGLHNYGAFSKGLAAAGVYQRVAGVEAHEQIGRGERHGGIFKENLSYVVKAHKIAGKTNMKIAAATVIANKNEMCRKGGIAPSQWVLGKYPRGVANLLEGEELGQLGAISVAVDPGTEFGLRAQYRHTSKKGFVQQDCSQRYQRAMLRNQGPILKPYQQCIVMTIKQKDGLDLRGSQVLK